MQAQANKAHGGDTRRGPTRVQETGGGDPRLQEGLTCAQASKLESLGRGDVGGDGAARDDCVQHLLNLSPVRIPLGAHIQLHKDPAIQLPRDGQGTGEQGEEDG